MSKPLKSNVSPNSLANLKPVKKGEVRNPKGTNANPVALRLRTMAIPEIAEIGTLILDSNVAGLQAIVNDAISAKTGKPLVSSKHSALKVWMATVTLRGINKGDPYALDSLLNRIVGKVPQRLLPPGVGEEGVLSTLPALLPEGDRRVEIERYQKMLENAQDVGIAQAMAQDTEADKDAQAIEVESRTVKG